VTASPFADPEVQTMRNAWDAAFRLQGMGQHSPAIQAGAECWQCSLKGCQEGPVPSTLPYGATFAVIAEAPGMTEVEDGETLVGASGREVRKALTQAGMDPGRVALINAIMCRPPSGDLKRHLTQIKPRIKAGEVVSPIDACRPRLQHEMQGLEFAVLMGGASLQGVGLSGAVMKLRGAPIQIPNGPMAVPTPHAAYVMRDEGRVFRPIFHADMTKAVRLSRGGNTWRDPAYFVPRSSAEVENFLAVHRDRAAVDVETDGVDVWTCNLRRVGIGTNREVMIYSPLSVHGHWLLPAHEIQACTRSIASYFQRAPRIDGHNITAFDSVVLWRHGMPINDNATGDSMIGHQIGPTSELPHSLDFLGSMYTDAPYWKDDVKHSNVKSDEVLDKYLSFDIGVTYESVPYIEHNLAWANQKHIYDEDAELFRIGRSMSMLGIGVDHETRVGFIHEYQEKSDRLRREFCDAVGRDVNPDSPVQVRKLLYSDLGLPILDEHMTDSGEASTDEGTLLDLLSMGVDKRAEKIIHAVLGCREAEKVLGTFTGRIEDGKIVGGPPIHGDGRLRVTWRPGRRSGRWSSTPNAQNWIKRLRKMCKPAPGNVYVAADMQAVELRMIAWLAGDEPLMRAFTEFDAGTGPDVHVFNGCQVFKCTPDKVVNEVRDFIKRFVYALNYDAEPPRIYQTLSLLRDDNLQPKFPGITLQEVQRLFDLWWRLHPAIPEWKKRLIHGWRSSGFIATRLGGRKRYFIGGERAPEMGNHDVQGCCAKMQNDAIRALVRLYPFDYANHRGLIVNGHDQLVVECAQHEVEDVKRMIQHVMQKKLGDMLFPAKPLSGADWKAVS
jgi:uracil-DNA glycosylase family 4